VIASKLGYIDTNLEITFEECNRMLFPTIGEAMANAAKINEKLGVCTFKVYSILINE
jgi:hypothetical protein